MKNAQIIITQEIDADSFSDGLSTIHVEINDLPLDRSRIVGTMKRLWETLWVIHGNDGKTPKLPAKITELFHPETVEFFLTPLTEDK